MPARNLCGRPPVTDCFGKTGRAWLAELRLPVDERLTSTAPAPDRLPRQRDQGARGGTGCRGARIATDPAPDDRARCQPAYRGGVHGRGRRHPPLRLRPAAGRLSRPRLRVRQSGNADARHGRISKAGSSLARGMLGEAAWSVAQTPGPLRAFFERIRACKGPQVAATATARKLACLFWCLLTREEDYAYARLSRPARRSAASSSPPERRHAKACADRRQQERSDARGRTRACAPRRDRLPAHDRRLEGRPPDESGCGRDTGARIFKALEGQSRATDSVKTQRSALCYVSHRTRQKDPTAATNVHLTFIRRCRASAFRAGSVARRRPA